MNRIENIPQNTMGAIPSGLYGSGVFPVSLFLFILATIMVAKEMVSNTKNNVYVDLLFLVSIRIRIGEKN